MVGNKIKIIWSDDAKKQLKNAFNYIQKDSLQNAKKVRSDITEITRNRLKHPDKYPIG